MIYRMLNAWREFWFQPQAIKSLVRVRIAVCSMVAIWFASFWSTNAVWFGTDGILASPLASKMIAFEEIPRWQLWSPLWWTDSLWAYNAWLAIGIGLAGLAGLGIGKRWTMGCLLFWMISWAHRLLWLTSATEPALIALVAYLLVEPGPNLRIRSSATKEPACDPLVWTAGTALRLIQVHWWILVAASLISQLGGVVWWRGEAVWWLASANRSNWFSSETLSGNPSQVNLWSHAILFIQMLALWWTTTRSARPLGIACGLLTSFAIGIVADQLLYALTLACCLLAFVHQQRK